ncbi:MAG: MFS transporter [Solirubrobacterales bacterium]|nr:MFS transporter [Solirubrobacterales bacterium]
MTPAASPARCCHPRQRRPLDGGDGVDRDVTRFLLGVSNRDLDGRGADLIAECAPARIRGGLIAAYQVVTVVDITIAYFADYALAGRDAWRIMLALAALASAFVYVLLVSLPDTPRRYVMRGREREARETLRRFDPGADVERTLREIDGDLQPEGGRRLIELLRHRGDDRLERVAGRRLRHRGTRTRSRRWA